MIESLTVVNSSSELLARTACATQSKLDCLGGGYKQQPLFAQGGKAWVDQAAAPAVAVIRLAVFPGAVVRLVALSVVLPAAAVRLAVAETLFRLAPKARILRPLHQSSQTNQSPLAQRRNTIDLSHRTAIPRLRQTVILRLRRTAIRRPLQHTIRHPRPPASRLVGFPAAAAYS